MRKFKKQQDHVHLHKYITVQIDCKVLFSKEIANCKKVPRAIIYFSKFPLWSSFSIWVSTINSFEPLVSPCKNLDPSSVGIWSALCHKVNSSNLSYIDSSFLRLVQYFEDDKHLKSSFSLRNLEWFSQSMIDVFLWFSHLVQASDIL